MGSIKETQRNENGNGNGRFPYDTLRYETERSSYENENSKL